MEMSFSMIKARIAEDHSERRQASRHRVTLDAKVRELGTTGIEATVLNISEQGFMSLLLPATSCGGSPGRLGAISRGTAAPLARSTASRTSSTDSPLPYPQLRTRFS